MKKRIIANISSNYAMRALGMALGFFLVPFLLGKLGKEVFGLIAIFESLIMLVESASMSFRIALSRHAAFSLAKGDKEAFSEYLSTGRRILFMLAAGVFAISLAASPVLTNFFRIPEAQVAQSRIFFLILALSLSTTIPNTVFWAGLYAKQRFDLINMAASVGFVVRAAVIFALFSFLPAQYVNLVTYGFVYLAVNWTQNTIIYFLYKKIFPDVRITVRRFSGVKAREVFSFGGYVLIGHIGKAVGQNALNLLVNRLWGPAANAVYSVGLKFAALMERLFLEPSWTLTPTLTELLATGKRDKFKELLFVFCKGMAIVVMPAPQTGNPMTYMLNGKQYVAVLTGTSVVDESIAAAPPASSPPLSQPRRRRTAIRCSPIRSPIRKTCITSR